MIELPVITICPATMKKNNDDGDIIPSSSTWIIIPIITAIITNEYTELIENAAIN